MTLQTSGAISLANIQTEFGGANPISLSEYYAGGNGGTVLVPSGTSGTNGAVPTSGTISLSNFYGTSNFVYTNAGYWGGGREESLSYITAVDALDFSSEVIVTTSATLAVARNFGAGVNSTTKGYFMGGQSSVVYSEIDGVLFSNGTSINPAATINTNSDNRSTPTAGVSSSTTGYTLTGGSSTTTAVSFLFSTEASGIISIALLARGNPAGVNSSIKGYAIGGFPATGNEVDGILFSTNTLVNPAAQLAIGRGTGGFFNSTTKGFILGGNIPAYGVSPMDTIDAFTFSTEAMATLGAVLPATRYSVGGGINSTTKGYMAGGIINASGSTPGTWVNQINGFVFSNETVVSQAAVLSSPRVGAMGVQAGSY